MSSVNSVSSVVTHEKNETISKDEFSRISEDKREKVLKAAKEFEAFFLTKMMENMRKTIPKNGYLKGGFAKDVYYSFLDQALGKEMSEAGGIGISDVLAEQFGVEKSGFDREAAPISSSVAVEAVKMAREGFGSNKEKPVAPVHCKWLGSRFGPRFSLRRHAWKFHKGIDLNAPTGTPVKAVLSGIVKVAGDVQGYGKAVYIEHENGVVTRYGHASELLVKPGEYVNQGQKIALVGATGRADGPHLHFEVRVKGLAIDPEPWLGEEVMNETAPNYSHLKKH